MMPSASLAQNALTVSMTEGSYSMQKVRQLTRVGDAENSTYRF